MQVEFFRIIKNLWEIECSQLMILVHNLIVIQEQLVIQIFIDLNYQMQEYKNILYTQKIKDILTKDSVNLSHFYIMMQLDF
ncbi:MAG: hypothetical protein EBT17_05155 [Actinobacteria bacterium]|nr:hypothetical protein [Actinomycetota bacterium]